MNLSKRSVEMLLDLVEIKLSYMDILDREDARDVEILERCRVELRSSWSRGRSADSRAASATYCSGVFAARSSKPRLHN